MKKNKLLKIALITTLILMIIVVALTYFELKQDYFSNTISNSEGEVIYKISSNATEYQMAQFKDLSEKMKDNAPLQDIAASVVTNYIADFYTLSNKKGTYDIGGMQYVYQPEIVNIYTFAKDYFYRDLSYDIKTSGAPHFLEVENVTITFADFNVQIDYNGQMYQSFYVTADWTYVQKEGFDTSEYQNFGEFSLLMRDGIIEIYRYYGE